MSIWKTDYDSIQFWKIHFYIRKKSVTRKQLKVQDLFYNLFFIRIYLWTEHIRLLSTIHFQISFKARVSDGIFGHFLRFLRFENEFQNECQMVVLLITSNSSIHFKGRRKQITGINPTIGEGMLSWSVYTGYVIS